MVNHVRRLERERGEVGEGEGREWGRGVGAWGRKAMKVGRTKK